MRVNLNISGPELFAVVASVAAVVVYLRSPASAAGFIHAIADLVRVVWAGG